MRKKQREYGSIVWKVIKCLLINLAIVRDIFKIIGNKKGTDKKLHPKIKLFILRLSFHNRRVFFYGIYKINRR